MSITQTNVSFVNDVGPSHEQVSTEPISNDKVNTAQQLCIRPRQVEHLRRIIKILSSFYFYIDGSKMGTGKTFIAAAVAIYFKLPVIVICPKAARKTWSDVLTTYGISQYDLPETGGIITYDTLRSRKGCQPSHGLLVREDSKDGVRFYATTLFNEIVRNRVFLIFDESQKLKNTSDQYKAAKALIQQFYVVGGNSRFALLSGSIIDKPEQAINILRMVGFIKSRNLYTKPGRGQIRLDGVEDLHNWARYINKQATDNFIITHPFKSTREGSVNYVFQLFIEVIRPGIMSIMPAGDTSGYVDIKNGYYVLEKEDEEKYKVALVNLARAVKYNPHTETVIRDQKSMGAVTNALRSIQEAKMKAMVRKALEALNKEMYNENGQRLTPKVALFADYYSVIDFLLKQLAQYNPVEVTGRLDEYTRNYNIELFQQHNANVCLLIGNPLACGISINLHDTSGLFPRIVYIMPGYRINDLHQTTGRFDRDGLIGIAYIRFFYGLSGSRETSILSAELNKGKILQTTHIEQGAKFPNQYEDDYEEQPQSISPIFEALLDEYPDEQT